MSADLGRNVVLEGDVGDLDLLERPEGCERLCETQRVRCSERRAGHLLTTGRTAWAFEDLRPSCQVEWAEA